MVLIEQFAPFVFQEAEQDELHGKRVHCWILVQAGKRDIPNNFFIGMPLWEFCDSVAVGWGGDCMSIALLPRLSEPSTGDVVPIDSTAYLGIESLFNDTNYWVNMQETPSISVCNSVGSA